MTGLNSRKCRFQRRNSRLHRPCPAASERARNERQTVRPTMSRPIIVFDLDGTLVDTAPDLVATLNLIFEREGLPAVPYDEARKLIGGGARAMIVRGLEADRRTVTPEQLDQLFRDFVANS